MERIDESYLDTRRSAVATAKAALDETLFVGGPPLLIEARLGLIARGEMRVTRRCLVYLLLTWVPLCALTSLAGTLLPRADGISLLTDIGVLARTWLTGPLLLAADGFAGLALSRIVFRFSVMCAGREPDQSRFEEIERSTLRLRDSRWAEAASLALACIVAVIVVRAVPTASLPLWQRAAAPATSLSTAGWWYAAVCLPLLLAMLMGWFWRLFVWTRFLILTSRLDLALVPVHPDRAAGLGFIGIGLRGLAVLAAAFGSIVAGTVGNQVVHGGLPIESFRYVIGGTAAFVVALFVAPLLAFSGRLIAESRRGSREYGLLALEFGRQFEREWFPGTRRNQRDMLEQPDFSAATDLYQVAERVQAMRVVPVDLRTIIILAAATLAPYIPVLFLIFPVDLILTTAIGLLR